MSVGSKTVMIQKALDRLAAGDAAAKEELIEQALERLSLIARKLLRGFGGEKRLALWTTEVVNDAYPRLAKAIDDLKPNSVPQFFALARLQMQRALLDHVRALEGRSGQRGPRPKSLSGGEEGDDYDHQDQSPYNDQHAMLVLDLMDAVAKLPDREADTVWLKLAAFTHVEIGERLGVHKDTVDRYWNKACVKLAKQLAPFRADL